MQAYGLPYPVTIQSSPSIVSVNQRLGCQIIPMLGIGLIIGVVFLGGGVILILLLLKNYGFASSIPNVHINISTQRHPEENSSMPEGEGEGPRQVSLHS